MRSGGRGGYLSELIDLIGSHAEPGPVLFFYFFFPKLARRHYQQRASTFLTRSVINGERVNQAVHSVFQKQETHQDVEICARLICCILGHWICICPYEYGETLIPEACL